jgi:hypothetical protein
MSQAIEYANIIARPVNKPMTPEVRPNLMAACHGYFFTNVLPSRAAFTPQSSQASYVFNPSIICSI